MIEEIGCWNCALDGVKSRNFVCPDCGTERARSCGLYIHEKIQVEKSEMERRMTREEMMDLLERAKILLKATKDLLEKQDNSYYVLNLLEETVFYDGVESDGSCLKDDIDYWFDELEEKTNNEYSSK